MKLRNRNITLWSVVLVIGMFAGCAKPPQNPAIQVDPGFQPASIDLITMLPPIDARVDKSSKINLNTRLNKNARAELKKIGYASRIVESNGSESNINIEDLKAGDPEWIKQLGPSDTNWVMILVLGDVYSEITFGSTGYADVSGFLFDKRAGKRIWYDKGVAKVGAYGAVGLIGGKAVANNTALAVAVQDMIFSLPHRSK